MSKLPGRVDIFGMKNLALPAPLTWQVPQLMPACRATPPRIPGELKARLPRLIIVRFAAGEFRLEYFARLVERVFVEFGFRRQCRLIAVDRKSHDAPVKARDQKSERQGSDEKRRTIIAMQPPASSAAIPICRTRPAA